MHKYELAVVLNAKLEEDDKTASLEKVKALIEKKLAYEIQKMTEGYYYFIQFDAEATAPAEIESRIRIMDNVIRYLIVRADEEA